jgi:hypothetical protein
VQNTLGSTQTVAPLNGAFRLLIFGCLAGALVGAYFSVQIISVWLDNAFDPRLLAAFGGIFGGIVGAVLGAMLGRPSPQTEH